MADRIASIRMPGRTAGRTPGRRRRGVAVLLQAILYALRGGFLVRPLAIALLLGAFGMLLSELEEALPALSGWVPHALFPSRSDPVVAQVILGDIATSIMTVVSIVFAILLMTLTLASSQFSPRILVSFVRDRTTQWTLGIFLGTFSYCMAALPAARTMPVPFSPVATVSGAMLLSLLCVGWLIFFIHHISQAISVNHIVDRIAMETELVVDELMPQPRLGQYRVGQPGPALTEPDVAVAASRSGYIRFIDTGRLLAVAKAFGCQIAVQRRVGHFVAAGVPILRVTKPERLDAERRAALLAAFDIGAVRTFQQDVEFGVIQIADIALKAISPAVNDPSTAITCLDQLGRILIHWTGRASPAAALYSPPHVLRVSIPWINLDELLDTAFEQIRHYAEGDLAVSLRLLRTLHDIDLASADPVIRDRMRQRAARVLEGCRKRLNEAAIQRLQARLDSMQMEAG